jgi:hypothetical protein
VYDDRPEMCRSFPKREGQISEFDECTFYFEGDVRKGECCGCGQCCVDMPWDTKPPEGVEYDELPIVKQGKRVGIRYRDKVCRYLVRT